MIPKKRDSCKPVLVKRGKEDRNKDGMQQAKCRHEPEHDFLRFMPEHEHASERAKWPQKGQTKQGRLADPPSFLPGTQFVDGKCQECDPIYTHIECDRKSRISDGPPP